MKISKLVLISGLVAVLSLAACAQPDNNAQVPSTGAMTQTPDAMLSTATMDSMAETPDAMMATSTGDAMMAETPDVMMATATGDAMMAETPDAMMGTPTGDAMMEKTPDAMMGTPTGDAMMAETPDAMMEAPEWFSTPLTDVRTGSSFTINDFKGKVVIVQNAATGCTACLEQAKQIQALGEMQGSEVVIVGLDGSGQDGAAALKTYAEENGFDGSFAIAPQAVIEAINSLYGADFFQETTPTILVIDAEGKVHPLEAGMMNADELKEAIEMYKGM